MQGEWRKMQVACDTGVQSALIASYLVSHPRCCRSGRDEHYVGTSVPPSVPEILQCTDKIGTLGVHPRHFIYENNLFPFARKFFEIVGERIESLVPIGYFRLFLFGMPFYSEFSLKKYLNFLSLGFRLGRTASLRSL